MADEYAHNTVWELFEVTSSPEGLTPDTHMWLSVFLKYLILYCCVLLHQAKGDRPDVSLAVPAFHIYGHKFPCQVMLCFCQ